MPKVFLIGGDHQGWALDTDLRLARKALEGTVEFVSDARNADFIHTVWPEELLENPELRPLAQGVPVVAAFSNDPVALFEKVPGLYAHAKSWFCVGQSYGAAEKLKAAGIPFVRHVPYIADLDAFRPRARQVSEKYLIGSFQRDTQGHDLTVFKPQKGADIFLSIVVGLAKRVGREKIQVLLAGPRRHWLMSALEAHGIDYVFEGTRMRGDDYPKNILSHERIAELTSRVDVYLVSSRWEGGPRAILETAACRRPIVSSDVGLARDVLNSACIYKDLSEAITILEDDFHKKTLARFVDEHETKVRAEHSIPKIASRWKLVYDELVRQGAVSNAPAHSVSAVAPGGSALHRALFKISKLKSRFAKGKSITIWGEMVQGPYGGGSQVLKAISGELERRGFEVHNNSYNDSHGHIMNSAFFDVEKAKQVIRGSANRPRVVHRIDGPVSAYRGSDRSVDDKIFTLNRELATSTAFQSFFSWSECRKMGFEAVNPLIIRNACDPALFFRGDRKGPVGKVRLISSSWSTNLRKGFEAYQYLDQNLDYSKYEYTFVGRAPEPFKNIKMIDAVASRELGGYLRESDVFIFTSLRESASNALLEAIVSGLPVIYYRDSGGNSEFTWYSGLAYEKPDEIPGLLEKILKDHESYRLSSYALKISEIADGYLAALGL